MKHWLAGRDEVMKIRMVGGAVGMMVEIGNVTCQCIPTFPCLVQPID